MFNIIDLILKVSDNAIVNGIVSWLLLPINFMFLIMDGLVYTLVAMAYKVFQMMAQLNFNTLGHLFASLTDRVRAIIAVLILFIIGYSLVMYLVNPDKASDKNAAGGVALIKNIAIASILLISYTTIFGIMNDFTLLLVGAPESYPYLYLGPIFNIEASEKDEGLIMRFINGGNSIDDETEDIDFGRKLAITTLSSFLHGNEAEGLYSRSGGYDKSIVGQIFNAAVSEDEFNIIFPLTAAAREVGRSVDYFPVLSTALGAYIVYMLATVSIQLGIRAFKLLVLQLLAPIAIITIMKDGWKSKVWSGYLEVLGKTYIDAFIRIGAMYFSFAFISMAYNNLGKIFEDVKSIDGITRIALYGVVIVAVLKLGKEIPAMIDKIFGSKLSENNKVGLGQFLGAAGGYVLGSASGSLSGAATRYRNAKNAGAGKGRALASGLLGGISGGVTGGMAGAAGGFKAKGGNIAEVVKNSTSEGWRVGGPGIGGFVAGAADSIGIGPGRYQREEDVLKAYEEKRDAHRKQVGSGSYSGSKFDFQDFKWRSDATKQNDFRAAILNRTGDVKFDFTVSRDEGVRKALMTNVEYRDLLNKQVNNSITREEEDFLVDFETAYKTMYDKAGGQIDRSAPEIVNAAKQISREHNVSIDDVFDKRATLGKIRNDLAYKRMNTRNYGTNNGGKK